MLDDLAGEITEEERAFLAGLRPSRVREAQAGRLGWTTVRVIDVEAAEGVTVRSVLELFGIHVERYGVGQVRHLVRALQVEPAAPYTLLCCHGDEGRIVIPELAPEHERFQPYPSPYLAPDAIREFARVAGSVVIATGCDTGTQELADAFFAGGASAYVAPEGAPFGYASTFAPVFLFYELTEGRTLEAAVERLRAHDDELAMWRLFRPA